MLMTYKKTGLDFTINMLLIIYLLHQLCFYTIEDVFVQAQVIKSKTVVHLRSWRELRRRKGSEKGKLETKVGLVVGVLSHREANQVPD